MKKLALSENKYIQIDTIGKDVQIFVDFDMSYGKVQARTIVPLSLIKLLTEINKHIFLEDIVYIYYMRDISERRQYTLENVPLFSNLVEWNGYLLFSEMLLTGHDRHGSIWKTDSLYFPQLKPRFTIEEWGKMYNYIKQIDFSFSPIHEYKIFTGLKPYTSLVDQRIIFTYWYHEENRYIAPEEIDE